MAIKTIITDIRGGDVLTNDFDLIFKLYGKSDNYTTPIHTSGNAINDTNVSIDNDIVTIKNVDIGSEMMFKISCVNELSSEALLSNEFSLEESKWITIDDSFVEKITGINQTILEIDDIVYFKKITNNGDPLTLVGQTYIGGNDQLRSSYTQNQSIDI